MNSYTIRTFRGGISDENNKGISGSFKFGYGLDVRGRKDVLTCGQALVKESGVVVTDLINFIIPCSDGNAYLFGNSGKIYKRKGTTYTLEYTDANGAIIGANEWNGYLYWACDTEISRIAVADADSSDWASDVAHNWDTTLTSADWHTMIIACGDLMICNDKFIALIDYSLAAFNNEALNLYPGNIAKTLDEDGFNLIIGTVDSGDNEKGYLLTWETSALNWIKKKKIPSKGINALITTEAMFAQAGVDGEVWFSNMVERIPLFKFPGGGYVLPGGVCEKNGLAMFGVHGNSSDKCGVYSYGRTKKNSSLILNLEYVGSHGKITGVEYGAIQMVAGTLLVSWRDTGTITMTIANPCVVTWTAHGLTTATPILFTTTGALPTGITASTYYYIRVIDANTFNLYDTAAHATAGGATGRITTTGTQSGVHTASIYGVDALSATIKANGVYESLEWDGGYPMMTKHFKKTKIVMEPLVSGCSIVLKYKINGASSWTTAKTVDGNSSFSTADAVRALFNLTAEGEIIEIRVELTSSANDSPLIKSVNTYFDIPPRADV
jgi:hypothetical protein